MNRSTLLTLLACFALFAMGCGAAAPMRPTMAPLAIATPAARPGVFAIDAVGASVLVQVLAGVFARSQVAGVVGVDAVHTVALPVDQGIHGVAGIAVGEYMPGRIGLP